MTTKNYFSYLLMLYVASTLIFSIGTNVIIAWLFNLLLLGSYSFYFLVKSHKKIFIHKFLLFYALFVIFSFLSVFWSIDTNNTLFKSLNIVIVLINIIIIYNISKYFKIENFILYGILIGLIYNYAILLEVITYTSEYTTHFVHRFVGTSNNPNIIAIYMLFGIFSSLILLEEKVHIFWKILLSVNIFLAVYGIINTASKKGIIFGILLLIIFFVSKLKSKKYQVYMFALIIIGFFLINSELIFQIKGLEHSLHRLAYAQESLNNKSGGSTAERFYMIQAAYEVFSKDFTSILTGTGQNTFALQNKLGVYAHNNYMEILANLGLIGFFLFYSMHYFIMKDIINIQNKQIKFLFIGLIIIIMLMDNAMVSYSFKPTLFIFIFITLYIENKKLR